MTKIWHGGKNSWRSGRFCLEKRTFKAAWKLLSRAWGLSCGRGISLRLCGLQGKDKKAMSGSREKKISAPHLTDFPKWMESARVASTCWIPTVCRVSCWSLGMLPPFILARTQQGKCDDAHFLVPETEAPRGRGSCARKKEGQDGNPARSTWLRNSVLEEGIQQLMRSRLERYARNL